MPPIWLGVIRGLSPWLGTAAIAGLVLLASRLGLRIICPMLALTGWQCPFCGGTRAAQQILRGDLTAAWHFNSLVVVALGLAIPLFGWDLWRHWRSAKTSRRPADRLVISGSWWVLLGSVLAAFTVLRNIF